MVLRTPAKNTFYLKDQLKRCTLCSRISCTLYSRINCTVWSRILSIVLNVKMRVLLVNGRRQSGIIQKVINNSTKRGTIQGYKKRQTPYVQQHKGLIQ